MRLPKALTTVSKLSKGLALGLYFVLLALGFYLGQLYERAQDPAQKVDSYQECVAAGHPVAESYPEVCHVPNGPSFTNPSQTTPAP